MDKPWKVIVAFIGVFMAGAVFGGFFSLGVGRELLVRNGPPAAPVMAAAPVAPVALAPTAAPTQTPAANPVAKGPNAAGRVNLPPAVGSARILRQIANKLDLTAAQKERITPLIQRAIEDLWRIEQNNSRENSYIVQRLRQDIGKQLTAEQRVRSDELWEKQLQILRARQVEAQAQVKGTAGQKAPAGANATSGTNASPAVTTPAPENPAASTSTPPAPGGEKK
jgi:Spy/CpxP family protein refolding chaperone